MADIVIPNPTWLALLGRLGIQRFGQWALADRVVPVALVDAASASLNVVQLNPLFGTPSSAGEVVGPAAGDLLADTGQLAVGNWELLILMSHAETGGSTTGFTVQRRDAANAANVWSFRLGSTARLNQIRGRWSVLQNERFRVITPVGANPGITYQASIFAVQT